VKSGTFSFGLSTSFNVNPGTKKAGPIKFVYHVNGFAEIGTGETFTEVEVGSGEANFKSPAKSARSTGRRRPFPRQEAKATEGKTGSYFGAIEETLNGGNLGFE